MISGPKITEPKDEEFKLAFIAIIIYASLLVLGSKAIFGVSNIYSYPQLVLFSVIGSMLASLGLVIFYIKLFGIFNWREFLVKGYQWLVLGGGALILFYGFALIASIYGINTKNQKIQAELPNIILVIYLSDKILLGPVLEEITFRRYLFELLRGRFSVTIAVLIVGFISSIMHVGFGLSFYIFAFCFSCLNSMVYLFGGLGASIIIHMFANTYIMFFT